MIEGGRVELFTYFNGFFVKQWKRYTQIRNPFAELLVQGNCRLALLYKDAMILTEKYTGKKCLTEMSVRHRRHKTGDPEISDCIVQLLQRFQHFNKP